MKLNCARWSPLVQKYLIKSLLQYFTQFPFIAWGEILYWIFFVSALGFSCYYEAVMVTCAANVSIFINLVPVNAIFLWLLLLAEPISLSLILGGNLVLTGVFFTNRS